MILPQGVLSMLLAVMMIGASCSTASSMRGVVLVTPIEGSPDYPPTDPASVKVLRAAPERPFAILGQIVIEQASTLTAVEVEGKLRKAAAGIGAHDVVILPSGSMSTRPAGMKSQDGQFIYAIAIRYKQ